MNSQHFCSLFHCTGHVTGDGSLTMIYPWFAFLLFLALLLLEWLWALHSFFLWLESRAHPHKCSCDENSPAEKQKKHRAQKHKQGETRPPLCTAPPARPLHDFDWWWASLPLSRGGAAAAGHTSSAFPSLGASVTSWLVSCASLDDLPRLFWITGCIWVEGRGGRQCRWWQSSHYRIKKFISLKRPSCKQSMCIDSNLTYNFYHRRQSLEWFPLNRADKNCGHNNPGGVSVWLLLHILWASSEVKSDKVMELLDLKELEEARKVVESSSLGVRRTPCILVRGDQACEMLPDMKQAVEGWDRSGI